MYIVDEYDNALSNILENGEKRSNRTGVDTLSIFSLTSTYRIDECFPLLTRRKLYPKAVFAELLWMLSGSTNNNDLVKLGANFWTPWVDPDHPDNKSFYDKTKFPPGYLGPVYGFQMRCFGGNYQTYMAMVRDRTKPWEDDDRELHESVMKECYGFDQIKWLVHEINTNPYSRRLIVSLWNPKDMHLMRLPPCHYCFHVNIDNEGRMTLLLNQRSCDFPVGVPANIQFYSALCYMLAQQTGYKPYKFVHHTEDAHIYVNQIDQVREYLSREKMPSPRLVLHKADNIFSYKPESFEIVDYNPCPPIKTPVTV